jgi:hypothetical protein
VDQLSELLPAQTFRLADRQLSLQFDQSLNQVPKARSDVGAKMNRLEMEQGKLSDVHDQLTQMLAEAKGTDLAKGISDLTRQQYVYQASLAARANIIQPALLDFLHCAMAWDRSARSRHADITAAFASLWRTRTRRHVAAMLLRRATDAGTDTEGWGEPHLQPWH